jgi:hypothetical protein
MKDPKAKVKFFTNSGVTRQNQKCLPKHGLFRRAADLIRMTKKFMQKRSVTICRKIPWDSMYFVAMVMLWILSRLIFILKVKNDTIN